LYRKLCHFLIQRANIISLGRDVFSDTSGQWFLTCPKFEELLGGRGLYRWAFYHRRLLPIAYAIDQQLRNWIMAELAEGVPSAGVRRIECMAKPVKAVEVFKALHLSGWFGEFTFKEVME
jgi:hypothetical protein